MRWRPEPRPMVWLVLLPVFLVLVAVVWPLFYAVDLELLRGRGLQLGESSLSVFVHRANRVEDIERVARLGRAIHGMRWGLEADAQLFEGEIYVAHDREIPPGAPTLAAYLSRLPAELPLALDLKETLRIPAAQERLLETLSGSQTPEVLFTSFDSEILGMLQDRTRRYWSCYLSWHIHPRKNRLLRIYEYYMRRFGSLGKPLTAQIEVDFVAYPWQSVEGPLVEQLRRRGVHTIAGGVDSPEALAHILDKGVYGIFTDSPEMIHEHFAVLDVGAGHGGTRSSPDDKNGSAGRPRSQE